MVILVAIVLFIDMAIKTLYENKAKTTTVAQSETTLFMPDIYESRVDTICGMKYMFIYKTLMSRETGYCIYVINLTKDSLECAYYKR